MHLADNKKIYFLSDFHLGAPDHTESLKRERQIVSFLDSIKYDAAQIFILGDIFDFWFEYKYVVPKGFVRILGKLSELADMGIPMTFFSGNHDMWMKGYFEKELFMSVYHEPNVFEFHGKKFLVGHGDGLGPGDHGYKFIKKIFRNKFCRWLFGALHPSWGIAIANYFSKKSRLATGSADQHFLGEENEWLIQYSKEVLKTATYDYFVFGHRHLPIDFTLNEQSRYINLGDWIRHNSYAVFDGENLELKYFKNEIE
jgi:UDP-2,3-diacylglucosamine hydrolase